jgi:hypothetical protein
MILWIWLILALMFVYFAYAYWRYSASPLRSFVPRRRMDEEVEIQLSDVEEIERELEEFKGYLNSMNRTIQSRFRVASILLLIAAGAAILGIMNFVGTI